jgi:hypothetical protein
MWKARPGKLAGLFCVNWLRSPLMCKGTTTFYIERHGSQVKKEPRFEAAG